MDVDGFWNRLGDHGERTALVLSDRSCVSHADLARRAGDFAAALGRGRLLVAVEMAPSVHAVVAWLGALAGGHAVVPLPAGDGDQRAFVTRRLAPDVVVRPIGGRWRRERGVGDGGDLHPDLAQVMTTSGSTGAGKFVRLSAAAVDSNARSIATSLALGPDDRAALVLPLHYSYGLSVLASHLAAGASVDLGFGSVLDPDFIDRLATSGCTGLSGVPYTFELLEGVGFRERMPATLAVMTVAGGRLEPRLVRLYDETLRRRGGRFHVMYGQTEATARIAVLPPERAADAPDRIGTAIPGGRLHLVDEAGRTIEGAGRVGELVYDGPNVMMGYAEERADLARGPEMAQLATGDLAERDADGLFRIVGRKARFSKIAGLRVGHDALEAMLARSGVEAAVTGDDRGLNVAYVGRDSDETVRREVAKAAGVTLRHVRVAAVPALPRTSAGKIDLPAVRGLFADREKGETIAAAFREAFWPHRVRDGDSFAALSGDSLRYVELSCVLERRLGRIPDGWERMSVAELSRLEPAKPSATTAVRTDLLIRALAILMVVVQHETLWPIPGGAAAMMVLIGFGLARFQMAALAAGQAGRLLRPLLSVLVPYYAIVAGYALAWGEVPWASVFLVGNVGFADPERHSMVPFLYWFVEAYAQTLVLVVAIFAIPRVRALARSDPFAFALALLAAALLIRIAGQGLVRADGRQIFALHWVLHLCAFGWCAAVADTARRRAIVLALALVAMPAVAIAGGNWIGSWVKFGSQVAVIAALLYVPAVRLPARGARIVLAVAVASYPIYLVHRFVPEVLLAPWQGAVPAPVFQAVSVVGGVGLGAVVFALTKALRGRLAIRGMLPKRTPGLSAERRAAGPR